MSTPEVVAERAGLLLAVGEARLAVALASDGLDRAEMNRREMMDPGVAAARKVHVDALNADAQALANLEEFDDRNPGAALADLPAIVEATWETLPPETKAKLLRGLLAERLTEFNNSGVIYVGSGDDGNGPTVRVSKAHLMDLIAPSPELAPTGREEG